MKLCSYARSLENKELEEWGIELLNIWRIDPLNRKNYEKLKRVHKVLCRRIKKFRR